MTARPTDVLLAIGRHPEGITSAQLSQMVGMTSYRVTSVCSRLFYSGKIARKPIEGINRAVYAWLPKEARP